MSDHWYNYAQRHLAAFNEVENGNDPGDIIGLALRDAAVLLEYARYAQSRIKEDIMPLTFQAYETHRLTKRNNQWRRITNR
jgi:hypothetical protein